MNIIKLSDNIGELEAVRDKAIEELQYLRSLDTAGDGKWFKWKNVLLLYWLLYLKQNWNLPKCHFMVLVVLALTKLKSSLLCYNMY